MTCPSGSSPSPTDIALLGGGFDPITLGHELMAKLVRNNTQFPVWVMPCFAHKFGKELAAPVHRLTMVDLVARQYSPWFCAFDYEIRNMSDGAMIDTLDALTIDYPDTKFHPCIGMDNANRIEEWQDWERLIVEYPFIVVGRGGVKAEKDWFMKPPHRFIDNDLPISSTEVRTAIEEKRYRWASGTLNYAVWDYIKQHGLYGYGG